MERVRVYISFCITGICMLCAMREWFLLRRIVKKKEVVYESEVIQINDEQTEVLRKDDI